MGTISRTSPVATRLWAPVQKLVDRRILLIVGGALVFLALLWVGKSLRNRARNQNTKDLLLQGLRLRLQDNSSAIACFKQALTHQPNIPLRYLIYLQLADSYSQNLQPEGVAFMQQQLAQTTDPDHRAMIQGAHAIILSSQSDRAQEAFQMFDEAVNTPRDATLKASLFLQYGEALLKTDPIKAECMYENGLTRGGDVPDLELAASLHYRIGLLRQTKNAQEALSSFQSAYKSIQKVRNPEPTLAASICLMLFRFQPEKDLSVIDQGLAFKGAESNLRGDLFSMKGELKEASTAYQQALKDHPEKSYLRSSLLFRLGTCYDSLGQSKEAIEALNRSLIELRSLHIDDPHKFERLLLKTLGEAYSRENGATARQYYEEALTVEKENHDFRAEIYTLIGDSLAAENHIHSAMRSFSEGYKEAEMTSSVWRKKLLEARNLIEQEALAKYQEAWALILGLPGSVRWKADIAFNIGKLHKKLGNPVESSNFLNTALKLAPYAAQRREIEAFLASK